MAGGTERGGDEGTKRGGANPLVSLLVQMGSSENCADKLVSLLQAVQSLIATESPRDEEDFNVLQNVMVAVNAEGAIMFLLCCRTDMKRSVDLMQRHPDQPQFDLLNCQKSLYTHSPSFGVSRAMANSLLDRFLYRTRTLRNTTGNDQAKP
ncbi:MAG: hypothetical protein WD426_20220 [Anditalea sp.]